MIGDWVRIDEPDKYAGATGQIQSLMYHREGDSAYFHVFIQGKFGYVLRDVCSDDIRPITLTAEILEKNGFKPLEEGSYVCKELSGIDDYRIVVDLLVPYLSYIEKNKMPKSRYSGEVKYVHQLQHALRLCGINKKIKLEE